MASRYLISGNQRTKSRVNIGKLYTLSLALVPEAAMKRAWLACTRGIVTSMVLLSSEPVSAQQRGGILRIQATDSPASMSIHEEVPVQTTGPMMGVFNNLVLYDQHVAQNSLASIVPDLAVSWSWGEDGKALAFKLRRGVAWHDGKPFSARDVQCTWELLLGRSPTKFRGNPRKAWYQNVEEVTAEADDAVTFRLKRPQPSLLSLLASGLSPIYPCHVPPAEMRQHPIGTGPFKFVEYKPHESIKLTRNPNYWKEGRPYLDGIEYTIIPNRATAILAFVSGKLDMTFPTNLSIPLVKEVASQAPHAICEVQPAGLARSLLINRTAPPFDNPEIRRAIALSLDRQGAIDILSEGQDKLGAIMSPAPEGIWGIPPEMLQKLPGYDGDVRKNRAEASRLMEKLGYAPDRPLKTKFVTRNVPEFRDTAVVLIDQLKQINIDGELELVETANWFPRLARKDYKIGFIFSVSSVDDPDQQFYENYTCGAERNYMGYCNTELEKLFEEQSVEANQQKRRELVWQIERQLADDVVRPIIAHIRRGTCWHPAVKGLTIMSNSIYNGWRFEDVWLER
jgi:peptide/nickel transport system substrate-binding protein